MRTSGHRIVVLGAEGSHPSADLDGWLQERFAVVTHAHATDEAASGERLTTELLSGCKLVIVQRLLREYTVSESDILRDWVQAGGALLSTNGYNGGADRAHGNSLLVSLGLEHLPGLHRGPVTRFNDHPSTAGLSSLPFLGGYVVAPIVGGGGANTVVAKLPGKFWQQRPAGIAQERGRGRVFVWGDEWIIFDSEWRSSREVPTFWENIVGWLLNHTPRFDAG